MDNFQHLVTSVWGVFQKGFHEVNAVEGLIIALIAAFILSSWRRLWAVALGATLVNLIAIVLIPVVANHEAFKLPDVTKVEFWQNALVLYVGYLIVIAVFFFIKRNVLRMGGGH